jgi:LacI family transcriptional regulator
MRGIARYVETHGPWSLFIDPISDSSCLHGRSENWKGDGILTYINERHRAERLRQSGIPTVELFACRDDGLLPLVAHDDVAVGRLAAEHLLERNLRHFAFCGYSGLLWSERRREGFRRAVVAAGCAEPHELTVHKPTTLVEWEALQQELGTWLRELPKPVGLLACSDNHAQTILDACRRCGTNVPDEVAVLGVDDDEEVCRLSNPPLSSVILNSEQVGYEGARVLDEMLRSKQTYNTPRVVLFGPIGVSSRRSTDEMAIEDPVIARAARMIRERACHGLHVDELVAASHLSRSVFYERFHRALGRSPHAQMLHTQLERVKTLLRQADLPLKTIAEMAGFNNPNYLNVAFKRETGMTPGQFQRRKNAG